MVVDLNSGGGAALEVEEVKVAADTLYLGLGFMAW